MWNGLLYLALLIACCAYAWLRGGRPEQIGAAVLAIGSVATLALVSAPTARFHAVELGIFLVDVAVAIGFVALALRANRFWPLGLAALQIVGTAGHAVKLVDPDLIPRAYAFALAFWSYPMLALIAAGTFNHQRRLRRFGEDRPWSRTDGRAGISAR